MRAVLAALVAFVLSAALAAGATTRPSLRVVDGSPLVVRGTGFAAGERVVVTVAARGTVRTRRLAAGAAGAFTVRFDLTLPCSGAFVRAVGARSGTVRVLPSPRHCIDVDP